MIEYAWQLLIEYFPNWKELLSYGIPSVIIAFVYLYFAGYLKKYNRWRTGYTRKVFHFLVFLSASIVQVKLELTGTIVFGMAVSIAVFFAIYKGKGFVLYEAMAREKDEPKQTYYIIMPYQATLFGGILSNIFFSPLGAAFGYLVTGFGDAVGEPFGTAFGKHQYKVPSLKGVNSYRSYEGSAAVFIACLIAIVIGTLLLGIAFSPIVFLKITLIAFAVTLVEAVSPHGWDNLTTQLVGSGIAFIWLI